MYIVKWRSHDGSIQQETLPTLDLAIEEVERLRQAGYDGVKADLSGANLSGANLSEANLGEAYLRCSGLSGAKLSEEKRKETEAALAAAQKELAELKAKGPQVRELTPEEIQAMTAGEVEKAQAATTERMQTLEKQLAQADPDTATFKVLFTSWQETYGKMMEALERIRATDSDKAGKLQGAIQAVVEGMA